MSYWEEISQDSRFNSLLDTLFYTTDFQELVECAAVILRNPVSVYNTGYYCIGVSNKDGINDDLWQKGKLGENTQYAYTSHLHSLEQKYMRNPGKYKFFYENLDGFGTHKRRMILLVFDSVVIGYLNVLQYYVDFDEIPEACYELVVGAITKGVSVARAFQGNIHMGSADALLYDILTESFKNKGYYIQRVLGTVFEKTANYRLLAINLDLLSTAGSKAGNIKLSVQALFFKSWSVLIDSYAVFLIDCGLSTDLSGDTVTELASVLERVNLNAGVSDCFQDLYDAKKYLYQAKSAADIMRKTNKHSVVAYFAQFRLWCAAELAYKQYGEVFVDETIQKMAKYDYEHNTEYTKTLFCYLDSKRSLKETAKKLNVHRNTVYYRIERINELFAGVASRSEHDYENYWSCLVNHLRHTENNNLEKEY